MAQITLNSTGVASSGALVLQSNGTTTAVTISTAQVATLEKDAVVNGLTVGRGAGAVSTNTAVGASALAANTTGARNTSVGSSALVANTTGVENTSVGFHSSFKTTTGQMNSSLGIYSLYQNTTGSTNVAIGASALENNTTASNNTAVGYQAGYSNTTGASNVIIGQIAGYTSTTGSFNTYVGREAGNLTTGSNNQFIGNGAGRSVTTGQGNSIFGNFSGNQGGLDIRTASNYIVLSDGDGNPLAYWGAGYTFLPSAYSITTASAANLFVASDGTLRRSTSALKYKQDIRDIEAIDINLLRGVRYKSKSKDDDETKDHFGVIADEVDAAGIKELVTYSAEGEVEGFQYERLTVVLLKAIQELKAEFDAYKASHP
jgi:hypothetical protein